MKYVVVKNGVRLSKKVEDIVIAKLSRLEKMLYTSDELECRVVVKSHGSKEEEAVDAKCGFEASTVLFTDQKCCGWYDDAQKQCCDKNEFCNS